MKKLLFAIALLGMAASCTLNEFDKVQKSGKNTISVVAGEQTRMAIATDDDVTFKHIWEKDDAIAVFDGQNAVKYEIVGEGGDVKADFTGDALKEEAPYPVFYPYSEDNIDIYEQVNLQNIFRYDFPTEATYQDGEHVIGGHVMYGFCDGGSVDLKNVCSFIRISLSAQELSYLDAIQIHAVGGEAIAGPAMIGIDEYGVPTFEFDESARKRDVDYSTFTVKFDSSRWITAGGTSFYVALPPVELSKGLEFFFEGEFSGDKEIYLKSTSATLERNTVLLMPNHDIRISYGLLTNGKEFNYAIKKMFNDTVTSPSAWNDAVPEVEKIIFQTDVDLTDVEGVDVSALGDGSVIAVKDGSAVTVSTSFHELRTNPDASFMFSWMSGLTSVENFDKLDTKMSTTIRNMFWNARTLKDIDLTKVDTRKVTSMWSTFCNMYLFDDEKFAIVSKWDQRNVVYYNYAFCGTAITEADLTEFNCSKAGDLTSMFQSCSKLKKVNMSKFASENVTDLYYTFYNLASVELIDISGLDTRNTTTMFGMFATCPLLKKIVVGPNFTGPKVTTMADMFYKDYVLEEIDMSNFKTTTALKSLYRTFIDCQSIKELDLSGLITDNVTSYYACFDRCYKLEKLDMSNAILPPKATVVPDCQYIFYGCTNMKELRLDKWTNPTFSVYVSYFCSGSTAATCIASNRSPEDPCRIWTPDVNMIKCFIYGYSNTYASRFIRPYAQSGQVVFMYPGKKNPWTNCVKSDGAYGTPEAPTE